MFKISLEKWKWVQTCYNPYLLTHETMDSVKETRDFFFALFGKPICFLLPSIWLSLTYRKLFNEFKIFLRIAGKDFGSSNYYGFADKIVFHHKNILLDTSWKLLRVPKMASVMVYKKVCIYVCTVMNINEKWQEKWFRKRWKLWDRVSSDESTTGNSIL